jgi:hypothetical protein
LHPIIEDMAWRVFLIAAMTSLPAILLALATLMSVLKANRQNDRIETGVNGRMNDLLDAAKKAAFLEGVQQGLQARRHGDSQPLIPPPPYEDQPPSDSGAGLV